MPRTIEVELQLEAPNAADFIKFCQIAGYPKLFKHLSIWDLSLMANKYEELAGEYVWTEDNSLKAIGNDKDAAEKYVYGKILLPNEWDDFKENALKVRAKVVVPDFHGVPVVGEIRSSKSKKIDLKYHYLYDEGSDVFLKTREGIMAKKGQKHFRIKE